MRNLALPFLLAFGIAATGLSCRSRAFPWQSPQHAPEQFPLHLVEEIHACRLAAPTWYRGVWFSFLDKGNDLGRKLLEAHMRCTGEPLSLGLQEMADIAPTVNLESSPEFRRALDKATASGGVPVPVVFEVPALASDATLGRFSLSFAGVLRVNSKGPALEGKVRYRDHWTLDESFSALLSRLVLPGKPFPVGSVQAHAQILPAAGDSWRIVFPSHPQRTRYAFSKRLEELHHFPGFAPDSEVPTDPSNRQTVAGPPEGSLSAGGVPRLAEASGMGALVGRRENADERQKPLDQARSFQVIRGLALELTPRPRP